MNNEIEANTNLSHYRIAKKIGAGGMGKIYLAKDTKLDRQVALKILPPEFTKDAETDESAEMSLREKKNKVNLWKRKSPQKINKNFQLKRTRFCLMKSAV